MGYLGLRGSFFRIILHFYDQILFPPMCASMPLLQLLIIHSTLYVKNHIWLLSDKVLFLYDNFEKYIISKTLSNVVFPIDVCLFVCLFIFRTHCYGRASCQRHSIGNGGRGEEERRRAFGGKFINYIIFFSFCIENFHQFNGYIFCWKLLHFLSCKV